MAFDLLVGASQHENESFTHVELGYSGAVWSGSIQGEFCFNCMVGDISSATA